MCYHVAEILESHIYQFDLLSVHVVMGESVDAINIQSEFVRLDLIRVCEAWKPCSVHYFGCDVHNPKHHSKWQSLWDLLSMVVLRVSNPPIGVFSFTTSPRKSSIIDCISYQIALQGFEQSGPQLS